MMRVRDAARKNVSFRHLNLLDSYTLLGKFDIIFCRNVAIYFDKETQARLWQRFNALLVEYTKSPDITKRRLYLETMTEILPNFGRKIILDEDAKGLLPLLNLEGASTAK